MSCTLCSEQLHDKNLAVFPCGHAFHLSCVFTHSFKTICLTCAQSPENLPDLGTDREIAMAAEITAKIQSHQLKPVESTSWVQKITSVISPLTPKATTFMDNIHHNKKLSVIRDCGFGPENAIQERIPWSKIHKRYSSTAILEFGFEWEHMVQMGIVPSQLSKFNWTEQQHKLKLTAQKLLSIRMTVSELSQLKYTTHQLLEMGFDWSMMSRLGANVDSWPLFKISLVDIKRYWTPSVSQWVAAGFYDKERLQRSGWNIDDIVESLPVVTDRCSGRMLRLAF